MKVNGLNITLVRGEYASLAFELVDRTGKPFIMLETESGDDTKIYFRVKEQALSKQKEGFIIDKELFFSDNVYYFETANIINVQEEFPLTYDPFQWFLTLGLEEKQLYYHPGLNEYAYFDIHSDEFILYKLEVIIPFNNEDTIDLEYKTYYYSIVLEIRDEQGNLLYNNTLVNQHSFTIAYQV